LRSKARELDIEEPGQPAVMAEELRLERVRLARASSAAEIAGGLEVSCSGIPQVALDEETLSVVARRVGIGLPPEPIGGPFVELGQDERLVRRVERARRATRVCRLAAV
jgi:hypothetical protein